MKTFNILEKMEYIRLWRLMPVIALALSVSSCTNDNEPNTSGNNSGDVFTIKANTQDIKNGSPQTRATVDPNTQKSNFIWQNDDKFDLYQSTEIAKANAFTINNSTINGNSADFTCSDFTSADAASYYAFYPQGFTKGEGSAFTYTIPVTAYTQTGNNNTDHLKNGMIMVANGDASGLESGISFTHKTALFRFSVMNYTGTDLTVKSINLSSAGTACFAKQYSYTVDGAESIGDKVSELNLGFGEGVAIANDAELKAYTLAIPGDALPATGESLTVEVVSDKGFVFSKTFEINAETKFEAGEYYTFNVDINFPLAEAVVANLGPDFESDGNNAAGWIKSTERDNGQGKYKGNSLITVDGVNYLAFNGGQTENQDSYLYQNVTLPVGTYQVEVDVAGQDTDGSGRNGVVFGIMNGSDNEFPLMAETGSPKMWRFGTKENIICEYNLKQGKYVLGTHTIPFSIDSKSTLTFGFAVMLVNSSRWLRISAIRIIVLMD